MRGIREEKGRKMRGKEKHESHAHKNFFAAVGDPKALHKIA